MIPIPDRDPIASLGDGRRVSPTRDSLRIYSLGKPVLAVPTPARPILIAPAASARAWIALMAKDASGGQQLVLARLGDALVTDADVDVSPGRVFEPSGKERWRAEAPMHARAFVAMSKQRVVMERNDGTLMAWNAASGKPIEPTL